MHQLARARCEAHQTAQRVGKAFGLKDFSRYYFSAGAHNGIAGAAQNVFAQIDGTRTRFEFASETVVHALKMGFLGIAQIEI